MSLFTPYSDVVGNFLILNKGLTGYSYLPMRETYLQTSESLNALVDHTFPYLIDRGLLHSYIEKRPKMLSLKLLLTSGHRYKLS